jgi:hypothetical protein
MDSSKLRELQAPRERTQLKPVIQSLAAVWLVLFVISFVALETADTANEVTGDLNRVVAFLTWQVVAFLIAAVAAFTTRYAVQRGADGVKLLGYLPLALSVFLVASFIAIMAVRFYGVPFARSIGLI